MNSTICSTDCEDEAARSQRAIAIGISLLVCIILIFVLIIIKEKKRSLKIRNKQTRVYKRPSSRVFTSRGHIYAASLSCAA
uniref:Protein m120 n=1 Tax=Mastomys natalensis cytomegalovirus 2 TaxID=2973540 RepID=A0A9Y1IM65_9BETA|nr:protein m120 [Mastomys natalensis cytomegalovirus 2]WEG69250.1 protein m120 [Mastomys natalensis cytomegalovirus 2]WEG69389.1 protein m120 [Mastomys natalensis cytomegalovirus 2]WEG69527.1 protein m120 [Mastomys natalensis cytomegalovirus 2]WEG69665.1 protein m120 [Mastomys natalensis cytomegalovirus 2]